MYDENELRADAADGARRLADPPGAGRDLAARLERDRVRSPARPRRQLHRRLQHGEHRSGRRAHRRLDRRRALADALRSRLPDAAHREHQRDPRAERAGRLQHPVRAPPGLLRVPDHRGQPARLAQLRARLESDGVPDRQDLDEDRARADARSDPEPGHRRTDESGVRTDARLLRREVSALAVRQVPARRHAPGDADEVDRRSDGDRPQLRRRAHESGARPRPEVRDADRRRVPGVERRRAAAHPRDADARAAVRGLRAAAARPERRRAACVLDDRPLLAVGARDARRARRTAARGRGRERRRGCVRRRGYSLARDRFADRRRAGNPAAGGVSDGRHRRRRVPRDLAVLLSLARRAGRDAPPAARGGRRRRQRSDPHRAGDRVRLLVRARRVVAARSRALRGGDQQQSRDGVDRLRRERRARLRAAGRRRGRGDRARDAARAG